MQVEVEVPVKDNNDTADRPEGKLPPGQPGTDEQVSAGAGDKSEDESSEASFDVHVLLDVYEGLRGRPEVTLPCLPCSATANGPADEGERTPAVPCLA